MIGIKLNRREFFCNKNRRNDSKPYLCSDFNIVHGVYTTVNITLHGNLFAFACNMQVLKILND